MAADIQRTFRSIAAAAALASGILVAAASAHLLIKGSHWLEDGTRAVAQGREREGVALLENAAKAYLPASPYPARALNELAILARAREMRGDTSGALQLWRVHRRAILASRHIYQPREDLLARAESEIIRIVAETTSTEDRHGDPLVAVQRPEDPSILLSLAAFLGLCAWTGGALLVIAAPGAAALPGWTKTGYPLAATGLAIFLVSCYLLD